MSEVACPVGRSACRPRACALEPVAVSGPTGQPIRARYARRGTSAVIELAEARACAGRQTAGWKRWSPRGELIRAAHAGCDDIVVGLGGSAYTDGDAGMPQALGVAAVEDTVIGHLGQRPR